MDRLSVKTTLNDVLLALSLLTRLPVPQAKWGNTERPAARAAWAYPLAGLIASLPALLCGYACLSLGLPASITALVMIAASIAATGAMHEDGLADCADGFWGGWERARRLEIMKDSAIGTYGVAALIIILGLKWAAITAMLGGGADPWIILLPAVMSRAGMVWVMQALPNARDGGLSRQTGKPGWPATYVALIIGCMAALLAPVPNMVWISLASLLSVCAAAYIARLKIGGQTGDVLGATQSIGETALLVGLAAQFD